MKRPFKVGDRVVVYERGLRGTGTVANLTPGNLLVTMDDEPGVTPMTEEVHPKQCRRLVPKRPRRKLYAVYDFSGSWVGTFDNFVAAKTGAQDWRGTVVEFVEARPKKKESK